MKVKQQTIISIFMAGVLCLGTSVPAMAMDARNHSGGIFDEQEYQEVLFITGEPILVTGELDAKQTVKNGTGTVTLRFKLENPDEEAELTRNVTLAVTEEKSGKQTVTTMEVKSFTENIDVGDDNYKLEDYQFSKSVITDDRPAAGYFTGNWSGRKTYKFNKDRGTVKVFCQGTTVGYENPWSSTETQEISGTVDFDGEVTVGETTVDERWSGTFKTDVTYSVGSKLTYQANDVLPISFSGGYVLVQEASSALTYSCRFPELDENGISEGGWDSWSDTLSTDSFPVYKRLPVYSFSDMAGHWASEDVGIITGLGIMSAGNYFGPTVHMTRGEFARAMARELKLTEGDTEPGTVAPKFKLPWGNPADSGEDEVLFEDVSEDNPYYEDIKAVYENGLLSGTGNGCFSPDGPVTKAQAVVAFIRALGFQNQGIGYGTQAFRDEASIPEWAKGSFHTAGSIGLISTDAFGYVNPNQVLTRAEAASLLHGFLTYLQDDLRYEYRDRLLNY